ncbi:glycosyltransferase family 4 protein [Litorilinea aerophila]|nr:glycosyltransferase family 4 protein [Litorilinea aerophila]MCC9078675.1 glycosyltransferase family 4 protein [Litorilinea aerophila]
MRFSNPPAQRAPGKIRLLLVITGLAVGGATNVVLELAAHFREHPDFEVELVTGPIPPGRSDATHLAHQRGIQPRVLPSLVNHIHLPMNLQAVWALWRLMRQRRYDIVHTHSSVAGIVGRWAAFMAGVPAIVHHVHGWGMHEGMSQASRLLYLTLERLSARITHRLIVVSRPDIQKGLGYGIGREEQFTLIYNGIDLARFRQPVNREEVCAELGLDPDARLVGMVGRLDQQKNPLDFIRAAALVLQAEPHTQFVVVGDGSLRPACERLIDELQLRGRVFLLGTRDDVARIVPILTVVAMSSLWEGLPIAFLEAMSAGKPIVANDVDGVRDVVVNEETGFLVTPRQPAEMAGRILQLLQDPVLCAQMGAEGRQRSGYFSVQRMVRQVESLYRALLAEAGRQPLPASAVAHHE